MLSHLTTPVDQLLYVFFKANTQTTPLMAFSLLPPVFFLSFVRRCDSTRVVRFLPSMPLVPPHCRATVPTAVWILACALFLALQVKCVRYRTILFPLAALFPPPPSCKLFIFNLFFFGSHVNHLTRAPIHTDQCAYQRQVVICCVVLFPCALLLPSKPFSYLF